MLGAVKIYPSSKPSALPDGIALGKFKISLSYATVKRWARQQETKLDQNRLSRYVEKFLYLHQRNKDQLFVPELQFTGAFRTHSLKTVYSSKQLVKLIFVSIIVHIDAASLLAGVSHPVTFSRFQCKSFKCLGFIHF